MSANIRLLTCIIAICPLVLASVGCAGLQTAVQTDEGIKDELQERNAEAVEQFERSRDFAEFNAALACWNRDDVAGCSEALGKLLSRNPTHRDGMLLMADVHLAEGRSRDARTLLEQALKEYPENAQVKYAMALLLDSIGESQEALAYYEQAVSADPNNEVYAVGYQTALAAVQTPAAPAQPAAFLDAAPMSGYDDNSGAVVEVPKDPVSEAVFRGEACLQTGDASSALAYFQQAVGLAPDNAEIPIYAAVTSLRFNQPALSLAILRPAAERFPRSVQVHRILGVAYYRLGDFKSSQVSLQQALSLDKSNALAYFLMGCTLEKLGKSESADAHYRQAQALRAK